MSRELEDSLARTFVERHDVKARQYQDGAYRPVTHNGRIDGDRLPWCRADFTEHIAGERSFGHYMVSKEGKAKLFAFDIDLEQPSAHTGKTCHWIGINEDGSWMDMEPRECNPREAWHHPKAPDGLIRFLRTELVGTATEIVMMLQKLLPDLPVAVSYSGNKGLHVYGLTGSHDAAELRTVAKEVLSSTGRYEPIRGDNFYAPIGKDLKVHNTNVSIEVFPKQANLDGKDLGNLMRLPLGVNTKSGKRAHFISLSNAIDAPFKEIDPMVALEGNPWI